MSLLEQLEASNWNEDGSKFHVFYTEEEFRLYLDRSEDGPWWREEYGRYDFEQCVFKFEFKSWTSSIKEEVCFESATFELEANFCGTNFKKKANFNGCSFAGFVDFSNCEFEEFDSSSYYGGVSFKHATFKHHVTFWRRSFSKTANFFSSAFLEGADFRECQFHGLLEFNHINVRGGALDFQEATFENKVNAWDIECTEDISFRRSNFRDKVNMTDLIVRNGLADFTGANFEGNAYFYDSEIHTLNLERTVIEKSLFFLGASIDDANRESYRVLKNEFIKQNNHLESRIYRYREMDQFDRDHFSERESSRGRPYEDRFIILANRVSNKHNTSPSRGVGFTLSMVLFFYVLFMIMLQIERGEWFVLSVDYVFDNIRGIFEFMNLTQWAFKPYGKAMTASYALLFIGRLFIGFGFYQTIQAFRKFKNT